MGGAAYKVTSVSFGVESANVTQPVTVRLYTNAGAAVPWRDTDADRDDNDQCDSGANRDGSDDAIGGDGTGWDERTGDGAVYAGWASSREPVLCGIECVTGDRAELLECDGVWSNNADDDSGAWIPEHAHRV